MAPKQVILRRLSQTDAVEAVRRWMDAEPEMHRTELADRLCDAFGFVDPMNRRRRTGCLKALRTLEARGRFRLPPPRTKTALGRPRRLGSAVPAPAGVPPTALEVRSLTLVLVETQEQLRIWNELFGAPGKPGVSSG